MRLCEKYLEDNRSCPYPTRCHRLTLLTPAQVSAGDWVSRARAQHIFVARRSLAESLMAVTDGHWRSLTVTWQSLAVGSACSRPPSTLDEIMDFVAGQTFQPSPRTSLYVTSTQYYYGMARPSSLFFLSKVSVSCLSSLALSISVHLEHLSLQTHRVPLFPYQSSLRAPRGLNLLGRSPPAGSATKPRDPTRRLRRGFVAVLIWPCRC
jgi:hypothetical protein